MGASLPRFRAVLDVGAQKVDPGAPKFVQWPCFGDGQEPKRRGGCACEVLGLRRGQRPLRPQAGVERQRDGSLEERGRCRQATAQLCPAGRALELGGDFLVGAHRSLRAVPGAAIGIELRVGHLRQRPVHLLPGA